MQMQHYSYMSRYVRPIANMYHPGMPPFARVHKFTVVLSIYRCLYSLYQQGESPETSNHSKCLDKVIHDSSFSFLAPTTRSAVVTQLSIGYLQ